MFGPSSRRAGYALTAGLAVALGFSALSASMLPIASRMAPPAGPAGVLAVTSPAGLPGASAELTRAPWLTDLTASSVQVSWATTTVNVGIVEYGPPGNCTANSVAASGAGAPISVNGVTEYLNSVAVTDLSASTTYCYRITDGLVDLLGSNPSPQFTTMQPADGTQPLTFDVFGDWGQTNGDGSLNVHQADVDQRLALSTSGPDGAQFGLTVGDIAYNIGGTTKPAETTYGDLNQTGLNISAVFGPSYWAVPGQGLPLFPGIGNHGKNATFFHEWPEPASSADGVYGLTSYPSIDGNNAGSYATGYYAFSAGGVRFYVLDASWDGNTGNATGGACGSNCAQYQVDHDAHWTLSSAEYTWLAADLAAHPGGQKFAFFHYPLYSDDTAQPNDAYLDNLPGTSGSLEQLLHKGGVQLAFTGHAHDYQRNIAVPGGVTSYVTGGGGATGSAIGSCSATDAYAIGWNYSSGKPSACGAAPLPGSDAQIYHFLKVSVNGTSVTVTPTDSVGDTFDVHTYNFAADTTAPSPPGNLQASQAGSGAITLSWTAATDNIGVSAYDVYRNGTYLVTVGPNVTSYTDAASVLGAQYSYVVAARDLAGNTARAAVAANGGSVVFADGFESGDMSNWTSVTGAIAPQTALTHAGSYAAEETSTGSMTYARVKLGASYTELWGQAWVNVVSHSTSGEFLSFRTSGDTSIAYAYVNASGKIALRNDAGGVTTASTTVMPTGSWHLITLHAVINGTSSSVDVSLDGSPVLALTGQNLGTSPIGIFQLGDNNPGRTYDIALDDVAVSQNPL